MGISIQRFDLQASNIMNHDTTKWLLRQRQKETRTLGPTTSEPQFDALPLPSAINFCTTHTMCRVKIP